MNKVFTITLVVLLFLTTGCTLSITPPGDLAAAVDSPTAPAVASMTATVGPSPTLTLEGSPTPTALRNEFTARQRR